MKLRKFFAGLAASVLALSMMMGTAMAQTDKLPFDYGKDAGFVPNNDIWVVLYGGTAATPLTDDAALRDSVTSVDVVFTGHCTFDAEIIANCQNPNWSPTAFPGTTVDGETTLNIPLVGKDNGWVEVVVNVSNKTEGDLKVIRMDFKDAAGNVVLSHGEASVAAKTEEVATTETKTETKAETKSEDKTEAKAETKAEVKTETTKATSVPKTGVASLGIVFALSAAVCGTGAVVLKKKEQ